MRLWKLAKKGDFIIFWTNFGVLHWKESPKFVIHAFYENILETKLIAKKKLRLCVVFLQRTSVKDYLKVVWIHFKSSAKKIFFFQTWFRKIGDTSQWIHNHSHCIVLKWKWVKKNRASSNSTSQWCKYLVRWRKNFQKNVLSLDFWVNPIYPFWKSHGQA